RPADRCKSEAPCFSLNANSSVISIQWAFSCQEFMIN
ncbi:MAG: hypothetical protein ACI9P7_002016, partial [Candidatus Azotimanducaceae bacterium]